ncbi:SdiA-regulated family protein [Pedobacter sp. PACM 27299]|uniref:SdiA-regulated domain-containing protein n=1 Tax=Pedobacter sp. PACM 27299 TaxID=1727164 RepID=UPI000705B62C|nr:SdiA-regulated domain-containing protein [Pedobacter sp. PACM 27299]ALL08873.1 SdiA-regulated family protein [Pedobacter sp. PACM 27299]
MKKIYTKLLYMMPIVALVAFYACKPVASKFSSPAGYDLEHPEKFNMPESLLEISGIAFYKGKPDTVYSIQDEEGSVFRQKWGVKHQKNVSFGSKGDYEDVAIFNEKIFILKSNGHLYSFPFSERVKEKAEQVKVTKKLVPKGEYESLYADPETQKVYVLCKSCPVDKKKKTSTGYVLNYDLKLDSLIPESTFSIDLEQIKKLNPKLKASLSPSALTKNPKTKEWYILASANKLLVIADENWKVKQVHRLNSSIYNQPEGIAFDNDMNLYISNEGDELTNGNILKFKKVK